MKIIIDEERCLVRTKKLNITPQMSINIDDAYALENNLVSIYGDRSDGCLLFRNQSIVLFDNDFVLSLLIRKNILYSIKLVLKAGSLTKDEGIYDEELCLLETKKLIEIITLGMSRNPDTNSAQGSNKATWRTTWGEINVSYEPQTPSVAVYIS